jgi:uncharacterized protein
LQSFPGTKHAFLYGSFAEGKEDKDSDVDIVLVGKVDEDRLAGKLGKLEEKLKREINYTLYPENVFKKELGKKGSFLQTVYGGKIKILKGEKYA